MRHATLLIASDSVEILANKTITLLIMIMLEGGRCTQFLSHSFFFLFLFFFIFFFLKSSLPLFG